jgi:sugar phosphate permease
MAWFAWYRDTPEEHDWVNAAERDLIRSSLGGPRSRTTRVVPWGRILSNRTLWVLSLMYFCYGYAISVYLDWFPKYLSDHRGFNLRAMGLYASLPLFAGTLGDLLGGWLSDIWAKRSGNLAAARRGVGTTGFLVAVAGILPATFTSDAVASVWYTCVAVFALELTVGVAWAIPLDIGGDYAGSVSAVMNMCGNVGGALSPTLLAYLVRDHGWEAPFVFTSLLCLVAAVLFSRIDATRRIAAGE